jgi:hypothetical protein
MMRDKRTGAEYQWPSPDQVEAALKLGSSIVPKVGLLVSMVLNGRQMVDR